LTMTVSKRFENNIKGGCVYIMAPWISKYQWHPFSMYENPHDSRRRHVFIAKVGDWTANMYEQVKTAPSASARPLWVSGPFPSPYSDCLDFDNMICVGSGVGITPALSAIEHYKDSRRCNLIWAVRDISMLVYFLENTVFDRKAINLIFYTGKEPLPDTIRNDKMLHDAHVQIIKSRPDLRRIIPNIINYFENPKTGYNSRTTTDLELNLGRCISTEGSEATHHCSSLGAEDELQIVEEDNGLNLPFSCASAFEISSKDGIERIAEIRENLDIENRTKSRKGTPSAPALVLVNRHDLHKNAPVYEPESIIERCNDKNVNALGDSDESKIEEIGLRNTESMVSEENTDAIDYLQNDFPKIRRDNWGILYCGRRNGLLQCLKRESSNLQITLHEEVFDW